MGKENEEKNGGGGGVLVGLTWSCLDVKLLLTSLVFICSLAALLQFFPSKSSLSPADFRACLSSLAAAHLPPPPPSPPPPPQRSLNLSSPSPLPLKSSEPQELKREEKVSESMVKRRFNPVGAAAYLFVQMGAYRGGSNTFAVIGLASKPLHVYAKPQFLCEWIPNNSTSSVKSTGSKILPDWGYGRVYTVVVVNCTFPSVVGAGGSGGKLVVHATTGRGGDRSVDSVERFVALEESPGSVDFKVFTSPPKYEYLYCGSPLYGNLSPQRVREWLAYHARLFGEGKSHFVLHDAGGVHAGVMEVLRPWIERGLVTLQDIRAQERFDGYYHNQFLVVNDCLHRYRFMARWMFFFDLDEFIYLERRTTLKSLLDSLSGYTQFTIEQMPMSNKLCLSSDAGRTPRMWGFEKLVFRDVKRRVRRDRKYAIQPRNAFATGVHMSQNVAGRTLHKTERRIKYFHYHGTIADRREPCREFANATQLTIDDTPFIQDDTLRRIAGVVKKFELATIGRRLARTRQ